MKPSKLSPKDFMAWRKHMGMSQQAAANRLGLSHSSICVYESGVRKDAEVKIPLLVALGMSAIKAGLTPYEGEERDADNN